VVLLNAKQGEVCLLCIMALLESKVKGTPELLGSTDLVEELVVTRRKVERLFSGIPSNLDPYLKSEHGRSLTAGQLQKAHKQTDGLFKDM